ncbi:hypothetical protein SDC9_184297 [bioreactor metagenome]|uniref:Uncharacterized protein n=1 Tax=bioreactor metagenome TaxID=1076179 RepID=A0A645HE28_9ZZZZ
MLAPPAILAVIRKREQFIRSIVFIRVSMAVSANLNLFLSSVQMVDSGSKTWDSPAMRLRGSYRHMPTQEPRAYVMSVSGTPAVFWSEMPTMISPAIV